MNTKIEDRKSNVGSGDVEAASSRLCLRGKMPRLHAFTLIELLVVITIIAILIALLAPALDQAIYQAGLVRCAAQHHAVAMGVTNYATESKRRYPYRPYVTQNDLESAATGGSQNSGHRAWPMNISYGVPTNAGWDDRPKLAPYYPLNKTLICPLIEPIDIEGSHDDSIVFGTWNFWYGWQYRVQNPSFNVVLDGMFRMGDQWNWTWVTTPWGKPIDLRTTLLGSTRVRILRGAGLSATHPVKTGDSFIVKKQDQAEGDRNMTYVRWDTASSNPGRIDINAAYADLSVRRLNDVTWNNDDRTAPIPVYANGADSSYSASWEIVPKE